MSAHAIGTENTPAETPTAVRVMRNIDIPVFLVALGLFIVAGFPIIGWITAAGAWAVQRLISEFTTRKAASSDDVRTRVGYLAGSMILRGWIVAGIIIAVGLGDSDAGLAAAVLFLLVYTLQMTMTMATRDPAPPRKAARR